MVVVSPFLIPCRKTPKLFEAVDQPLDLVAPSLECPVKRPPTPLVRFLRNRDADASPSQKAPNLPAVVSLVSHNTLWSQLRPPPSRPLDRPLVHQALKRCRFMSLARCQHNRHRFAVPVGAEMDLGAESALAPAQRFGF